MGKPLQHASMYCIKCIIDCCNAVGAAVAEGGRVGCPEPEGCEFNPGSRCEHDTEPEWPDGCSLGGHHLVVYEQVNLSESVMIKRVRVAPGPKSTA